VVAALNVQTALENGLFALGQILRFPVMSLLWGCVAAALFISGACLVESIARRRERSGFDLSVWLQKGAILGADSARVGALPAAVRTLLQDIEGRRAQGALGDGDLEHLVLRCEERARRSLNGSRALVKVGPSLGLLGTLIPMGTSLASLASGNLQAMAGQMVVAFTTTIIGLATGTAAYAVAVVRQNWVNEAVREQRYLAERIARELAQGE
jgi:biopolymer transport protein ExbB/TolQ